ncbi:tetratricopeptide repeat protein [Desulfothermobacter acidiphilus]|uniref:tetratricopeptide repeat protein n=1 Tax=Desulfothermobacter acidiphilus TaxID=1938353 RepID=UPI003F88F55D
MVHFRDFPGVALIRYFQRSSLLLAARVCEFWGARAIALRLVEKVLRRFPRNRRLALWAGRLAFHLNRTERALQCVLLAWPRLQPKELTGDRVGALAASLPRRDAAWILVSLGDYWRRQGEARRALSFLDRALALGCHTSSLFFQRGWCLLQLDAPEEALRNFQEARLMGERGPLLSFNLAVALSRLGRYSEALRYFQEAQRRGMKGEELHNNMGFCLFQLHRYREAEACLEEAFLLSGGDVEFGVNLAACYLKNGKAEQALDLLLRLKRSSACDPVLLNNLAFALEACGRGEEALAQYQEAAAIASEKDKPIYLLNLASCLVDLGRYGEALALCHRLAGEVSDRRLWSLRASILAELGEAAAATECYRRALGFTG